MRPKKFSDEDILTFTRSCLLREGANVSTQRIADELGVSQAMLFKRFGTKKKLLVMALAPPSRIQHLLLSLEEEPTMAPALEQLMGRCRLLIQFYNYMLPGWMILQSLGYIKKNEIGENRQAPIRARKAMTRWVVGLQKKGLIRDCAAESVALSLIGAMMHRAFRQHVLQDSTMEDDEATFIESTVELFGFGLIPKEN